MARATIVAIALAALSLSAVPTLAERPALNALAAVAQDGPRVLYSSTLWTKDSNAIEGSWRIENRPGDGRYLVIGSDFSTKNAPDLKFVLATKNTDGISKKNVLTGGHVIANLTGNKGAQEYRIDAGVDLSNYSSLAIHCEQYTKLWGASNLSEGTVLASSDEWVKKSKKTKGGYEIVERESGLFIRFADDFKTAKAPEPLRILLTSKSTKQATSKNAEEGATFVAEFKNPKGAQEYRLEGVDSLEGFDTVLLNCMKYTKLWSAAPLNAPAR